MGLSSKRNKIVLNYVVGPLLFILLSLSIYNRIRHQENLQQSWNVILRSLYGKEAWKFYAVLALSLVNWGFESRKWQILVKPIQRISFLKAYKAVLTGLSLSLFIPNRVGEYLGRMLFMEEGNRLRSIALTVVGSISQLIITLVTGIAGFIYLKAFILEKHFSFGFVTPFWINVGIAMVGVAAVVLLLVYYRISGITKWLEHFAWIKKIKFYIEHVEDLTASELTRVLRLSFLRYLVFVVQYVLLMQLFQVEIPWLAASWMVTVLFLVLAVVPTLPVAEIGLRGEVSLQLFGMISTNVVGIVATAAGIWLINIIIPAIAGALFVLGVKLFGNK